MIAKLRRPVALLLVLLTLFSLVPFGFADGFPTIQSESGVDPPTGETAPIEEDAATEPPAETTEPLADASTEAPTEAAAEETTQPPTEDSSEETIPEDAVLEDQLPDDLDADDRILDADTYASTQNSIMLFDYADNGDYTTRLNYQVSCTYQPNGSGTTRTAYIKNMGWHFARYGGVAHADEPLYCIEPWRNYGASTSGNSVDRDVTLYGSGSSTGSNVWYALPSARREAIGLILLYSNQQWNHSVSVTTTKRDSNPNVPLRVATQMLIYEIVCGLRDPYSFNRNSTNECGTAGDVFYNAGAASLSGFTTCYNNLVWAIQAAKTIPSFCGSSSGSAPTIQLSGDSGSAYDSNGVLSNFSFSNGNGASFLQKRQHPVHYKVRQYFRVHGIHRNPLHPLCLQFQLQYLVYVRLQLSDNHFSVQCGKRQPEWLFQNQSPLFGQYQPDQNHRGRKEPFRLEIRNLF